MGYFKFHVVLAGMLFFAPIGYADERVELLQFTCRPEYDFFAVRSMRLESTISYRKIGEKKYEVLKSDAHDPTVQKESEKQGFYTVKSVREKPYSCELDDRSISVKIQNYESYDGKSECTASPKFDVQILVDGNPLYSFPGMGNLQCRSNENHAVTVRGEELQDCKLPNLFSLGDMQCSNIERPELLKLRR